MKMLRNLTAATAVAAVSAGLFALPALAQDGSAPEPTAASADASSGSSADTATAPATDPAGDSVATPVEGTTATPAATGAQTPAAQSGSPAVINKTTVDEIIETYGDTDKTKWAQRVKGLKADNVVALEAFSPSMNRKIPLAVITPDGKFDEKRPTIYLLNGAGGAEQGMDWISMTAYSDVPAEESVIEFYKNKGVNVVIPMAGAFSYYTDWVKEPNSSYLQGPQMWETFLTKELPEPLEAEINGNGKRAIAGMSMSATSSLLLAEHNPGFYDAVGSYSGCAATSTLLPNFYAQLTVSRGGGDVTQMWGPRGGEYNVYNDALINANNLRDTEVYVSTNSGLAGAADLMSSEIQSRGSMNAFAGSSTLMVEGGAIEAAMNSCTHDLKAKMDRLGIPADWNFRTTGTHSWPGWRADLKESWPTYARAFGMEQ
ncbi:MAG: alpha/beta hydrolase family protein [Corynebacterium sp.]|nr:alpha/beta hydrolase family protein [Corynebacterium sp.]